MKKTLDKFYRDVQVTRFEGLLSGRPLPKFLILHSADDRFRLQNPGILLNLTVPQRRLGKMDVKEAAQTANKSGSAVLMIVSLRDTRF